MASPVDPPSLKWLNQLDSLEAELKTQIKLNKTQLAKKLEIDRGDLHHLINIGACLDPSARERIRQAAAAPNPHIFSHNNALALEPLIGRVSDVFGSVHIILDRAIPDHLKTTQIMAMVDHLIHGKPPGDFDHTQVKRRSKGGKNQLTEEEEEPAETEESQETDEEPTKTKTTTKTKAKKLQKGTGISGTKLQWLEELLAGVSVVKPALKKAKKGEPLTGGEWWLLGFHIVIEGAKKIWKWAKPGVHEAFRWYHEVSKKAANFIVPHPSSRSYGSKKSKAGSSAALDKPLQALAHWVAYVALQLMLLDFILSFVPRLKPWAEWPFKWFVHEGLVILPAEARAYANSHLVLAIGMGVIFAFVLGLSFFKKPAQTIVLIVVLVLAWCYGRSWSSDLNLPPLFSKSNEPISTPVSEQPTLRSSESVGGASHANSGSELAQPKLAARLEGSQQAPVAFNGDDAEKSLLEAAITAIPPNSVIKSYPVIPDSSMGSLMAVNRVTDLAVESEYSLRVGQSGQKITSVTPSATGLVIATEGGLPLGGLLGDSSKLGFYWEDVQTIYTNELDTPSGKTYQVTWTATNLNQPIVVQCHTPNNLNHLVSALEYFIKATQGKYVPVTAMPYLNQGMVIGDEGKITALWAGSPADQAGLTFKDHIWSVQGNQEQKGSALDSALQTLPSGKQTINGITPADWAAAREKESRSHQNELQPKLTEFQLFIP